MLKRASHLISRKCAELKNLFYFLIRFFLQYNTPGNPADYVHRVGRTARIGLKGHALLFLTPAEVGFVD